MSLSVDAKLNVQFFGRVGDVMGKARTIDLPETGWTLGELRRRLAAAAGSDILLQPGVRGAIDKQVMGDEAVVRPGAEVAFFSLFSGG
jgi:molybdopterin converting factor small subunit